MPHGAASLQRPTGWIHVPEHGGGGLLCGLKVHPPRLAQHEAWGGRSWGPQDTAPVRPDEADLKGLRCSLGRLGPHSEVVFCVVCGLRGEGVLSLTSFFFFFFFWMLCLIRGLFIIDDRGILRQITMNDLSVSIHKGKPIFKCFWITPAPPPLSHRSGGQWMRRYDLCRHSSTQMSREKVYIKYREAIFTSLCFILSLWHNHY